MVYLTIIIYYCAYLHAANVQGWIIPLAIVGGLMVLLGLCLAVMFVARLAYMHIKGMKRRGKYMYIAPCPSIYCLCSVL